MQPIRLSALTSRWLPRTEEDLKQAIHDGLLTESHYFDAKRELSPGKGSNKELARDLASFAVDGGTLAIGIEEDKTNRTMMLAPQPLKGLAEKVDQIARSTLIDPPLPVSVREIGSAADPARGYLLVEIPASPDAPHMVDGRYYGRSDTTKIVLSDLEIRRLHERRRLTKDDALALLQYEIDRDPIPAARRNQSHLFLVAQPINGHPELLLDVVADGPFSDKVNRIIDAGSTSDIETVLAKVGGSTNEFRIVYPDLTGLHLGRGAPRADGIARTNHYLGSGRGLQTATGEDALELEIREDGGLRVFFGRFSILVRDPLGDTAPAQVVYDIAAVASVRRFLGMVAASASEAGYLGSWALAVAATDLRGKPTFLRGDFRLDFDDAPLYTDDVYRRAVLVTRAQLLQRPGAITKQLVGALLRAMGTTARYQGVLSDLEPPAIDES